MQQKNKWVAERQMRVIEGAIAGEWAPNPIVGQTMRARHQAVKAGKVGRLVEINKVIVRRPIGVFEVAGANRRRASLHMAPQDFGRGGGIGVGVLAWVRRPIPNSLSGG